VAAGLDGPLGQVPAGAEENGGLVCVPICVRAAGADVEFGGIRLDGNGVRDEASAGVSYRAGATVLGAA
jgi:hypothetical protein